MSSTWSVKNPFSSLSTQLGVTNVPLSVKVGVTALLGLSTLTIASLSLLHFYAPFKRGRGRRAKNSQPFPDGFVIPATVKRQFYTIEEYSFVELSLGRVRYFLRQPTKEAAARNPSKAVVVLVHGFSIPADIWKQQSDHLVELGHTVLSFDNYGRGWSDAPDVEYGEELYVGQLAELLFALDIKTPIDLIGVSMGGAIVASFAARYPSKVARLGMMCPAGLPIKAPPSMANIIKMPIIGAISFKNAIPKMHERGAAAQWEDADSDMYHTYGAFARQNVIEHDGFIRTLYRTVVQYPMTDQRHNYEILAQQKHLYGKFLILWGEKDGLTPASNGPTLQSLLPGAQLVIVQGAKHNMMNERPQVCSEVIAAWLADSSKKLPATVKYTLTDGDQQ